MSAAGVTIEFASAGDAHRISALSHRYVEYGLRRRYTPAVIRQLLRHRSKNVVVARLDGALIGFGIMTYRRDSANLDLLAVRKPYRRRGVGRQIVDWLEKVARTAGIANVFVQVRNSNSGAIRCYQTLGYQAITEVDGRHARQGHSYTSRGIHHTMNLGWDRARIGNPMSEPVTEGTIGTVLRKSLTWLMIGSLPGFGSKPTSSKGTDDRYIQLVPPNSFSP